MNAFMYACMHMYYVCMRVNNLDLVQKTLPLVYNRYRWYVTIFSSGVAWDSKRLVIFSLRLIYVVTFFYGVSDCGSDHNLLIADVNIKLKRIKRTKLPPK